MGRPWIRWEENIRGDFSLLVSINGCKILSGDGYEEERAVAPSKKRKKKKRKIC